jgi:tetratricopeptide (TPR) repeat protein
MATASAGEKSGIFLPPNQFKSHLKTAGFPSHPYTVRIPVRKLFHAAVLSLAVVAVVLAAGEVKLRIYLQDGSLQAGNLITENPDSFVILGKDGRVEIQKKNIMFINGKTLKQWNERPDKLFQTEIMPSDVPNPAYVNDKSLPPPPPVPQAPVKSVLPPAPPPSAPAAAAPAEPASAPGVSAMAAAIAAPVPPSVVAPAAAAPRDTASARRAARAARAKARPQPEPAAPAAVAAAAPARPSNRRLQERAALGATHRERGFALLAQGRNGAAMKELMIARVFEPNHGETFLALARMYHDAGLNEAALKFLDHFSLRKSDAAAALTSTIQNEMKRKDQLQLRFQILGVAGAFAWLPFVLLYRRFRRRKAAAPVTVAVEDAIEAPSEEEASSAPETPTWVAETEAAFTPPLASPPPMPSAPPAMAQTLPPPPPRPLDLPAPETGGERLPGDLPPALPEAPVPLAQEPLSDEPVAPEPAVPETVPGVEAPRVLPTEPAVPEEVRAPVPEAEPEPIPELMPLTPDPVLAAPDPREILANARGVEYALIRGNQAASEGRLDEGRRAYRTALALNSDCASAHLGLGYLAFFEERWEVALVHYRKALDIDPSSADAHYGIARVLLEINRLDEAVPELRATLTLDPTNGDARDALTAIGKPA